MKQKLLNSFTWRGTLLVALLSCAFSAWGAWQDDTKLQTKTLTFSSSSNLTSVTSDGLTWTISSNVSLQYDNSNKAIYVTKEKSNNPQYINLTTSTNPIVGTITKITVNCKSSATPPINVSVNNQSFGSTSISSSNYSDYVFTGVAYCDQHQISVAIGTEGTSIGNGNQNIYVKSIAITYMPTAEIPIKAACNDGEGTIYGTFSYPEAFVVPSGLTVAEVSVSGGTLAVTPYDTDDIVPFNTGVMVSCTSTSDVNIPVFLTPNAGTAKTSNNMLRPTGSGISATAMGNADSGCQFYYLTMNGSQIGFYRRVADDPNTTDVNEEGAAFDMLVANKAYLAVPSGQVGNVKGYTFGDGTNGIKAVETEKAESNAIYNLAGQRVSKMQKGLYIVNGKKVLIK